MRAARLFALGTAASFVDPAQEAVLVTPVSAEGEAGARVSAATAAFGAPSAGCVIVAPTAAAQLCDESLLSTRASWPDLFGAVAVVEADACDLRVQSARAQVEPALATRREDLPSRDHLLRAQAHDLA